MKPLKLISSGLVTAGGIAIAMSKDDSLSGKDLAIGSAIGLFIITYIYSDSDTRRELKETMSRLGKL